MDRSDFDEVIKTSKDEIQKRIEEATESSKRVHGIELDVITMRLNLMQYGDVKGLSQIIASEKSNQNTQSQAAVQGIALVSESKSLTGSALAKLVPSFQKQIDSDLEPIWSVGAKIEVFDSVANVPSAYWPLLIKERADMLPGAVITRIEMVNPTRL
jgi:hypothetical protein